MAYRNDLQLAFSGKEIASERIAIIDSTEFTDVTAERFSKGRREKYQKLLEKSEEKIAEIKSRIAEDISAKKFQLESFKNERTQVNTRYQLREISHEEHQKIENALRKKFDKVKAEATALQQLYGVSRSSEIGGLVPLDIDKDVDVYGNIIKKQGLNIPSNIKMPEMDALSNIKVSSVDSLSNLSRGISIPSSGISRGNLITIVGVIAVIIVILFLASAIMSGEVTVIVPDCRSHDCVGYEWNGSSNLKITEPGKYAFAKNAHFPDDIMIVIDSAGVTLDGKGVTLMGIEGREDLDLQNIRIESINGRTGITKCRNIKKSSIIITSGSIVVSGIEELYGNIDDTTSITVTLKDPFQPEFISINDVYAVKVVHGTVSGGTFTVSGSNAAAVGYVEHTGTVSGGTSIVNGHDAFGIKRVSADGTVSGGTFTVTAREHVLGFRESDFTFGARASGIESAYGTISGGTFIIHGPNVSGIGEIFGPYSDVSGGTFTVTGEKVAVGIGNIGDFGEGLVSGGRFTVTAKDIALGIGYNSDKVAGGKFTVDAYRACGILDSSEGTISGGTFVVNEKKVHNPFDPYCSSQVESYMKRMS